MQASQTHRLAVVERYHFKAGACAGWHGVNADHICSVQAGGPAGQEGQGGQGGQEDGQGQCQIA